MTTNENPPRPNITPSVVRTAVPIVVGLLLTALIKIGVSIPSELVSGLVTAVLTSAYYAGVRFLETHYSSQWGWLIGLAKAPQYAPAKQVIDTTPLAPVPPKPHPTPYNSTPEKPYGKHAATP